MAADWVWIDRGALMAAMLGLFMRCLPFIAYVWLTRRHGWLTKGAALAGGVGLAGASGFGAEHMWLMITLAYFGCASLGVYWLEVAFRRGVLTAGAVFALTTSGFLLVPALLLPGGGEIIVLAVGWELSFAAYSYCRDAHSFSEAEAVAVAVTPSDCLFFLMVNPVLVYPERCDGKRGSGRPLSGLARACVGLVGLLLGMAVLVPLLALVSQARGSLTSWHGLFVSIVGLGVLRFVCAYFVQAGTANVRIGLMRALGYPVPDSFNYPFLASSPTDFWRRWNVYMLNWLKRYVYRPMTRREPLRRAGPMGLAACVFATFVLSGLLHETHAYARNARWVGHFAAQFAAIAVALVAWLMVDRGLKVAAQRFRARQRSLERLRSFTARAVVLTAMLTIPMVWG